MMIKSGFVFPGTPHQGRVAKEEGRTDGRNWEGIRGAPAHLPLRTAITSNVTINSNIVM